MNKLTVVLDKLIYKRYGSVDSCMREYTAWKQFNELVPENTPSLVVKKNDLCVYEFLGSGGNKVGKHEASIFAAQVISNVYNCYDPFAYKKGEMWDLAINRLIQEFSYLKKLFTDLNFVEFYNTTLDNLEIIRKTNFDNISFLHRDIHKGNIIYKNGHPYLIDHEHAMEGPIELELQNSLFWNDRMSLNTKLVKKHLKSSGIRYSDEKEQLLRSYYIADQIYMAAKDNKLSKVQKIIRKAKIYC
jgi:thiamine kinase-like enzyme